MLRHCFGKRGKLWNQHKGRQRLTVTTEGWAPSAVTFTGDQAALCISMAPRQLEGRGSPGSTDTLDILFS